ncbi:sigma-70 family RNA polymerase sigma factor [Cyanobacteria bacterium FACHB-63]|nr:sigma-70 family RNA polymerase sigma factor [Cyanobacteria bacterium FACHB-63]
MISKPSADSSASELLPWWDKSERFSNLQENHQFEKLLVDPEHRRRIDRIAQKQTRGTSIPWEEAAQTAHLKLVRVVRAGKFQGENPTAFYRWALTVARFEIIDLVRKESNHRWTSLDQTLPGTDISVLETISDDFNLFDSVEQSDLVLRTIDAIAVLDQQYPDRDYLKLWQGQIAGKNQSQLAAELGLNQSTISKRWKELTKRLTEALGLLQAEAVQQTKLSQASSANFPESLRSDRKRTSAQW